MKLFAKKAASLLLTTAMAFSVFTGAVFADEEKQTPAALIKRCYSVVLGRDPDADGAKYWEDQIADGMTGTAVAASFVFSQEFENSQRSNWDFLGALYELFMGRDPDEGGFKYWNSQLEAGMSRADVFTGFANSEEFFEVCEKSGVVAGYYTNTIPLENLIKINNFVNTMYTAALERNGDREGVAFWCSGLINGSIDGITCAANFVKSNEFKTRYGSAEEYIRMFYRTFLMREAEQDGYDFWLDQLKKGMSRDELFGSFACSPEFATLCQTNGISVGTFTPDGTTDGFDFIDVTATPTAAATPTATGATPTADPQKNYIPWKKIELSGNKEDTYVTDIDCCYEDDRFVLYYLKGTTVRGDAAEIIKKVMKAEEEYTGLSFDMSYDSSEFRSGWKIWCFDHDDVVFEGINEDDSKIEIVIRPEVGSEIQFSDYGYCILFEEDLFDDQTYLQTLIHELAHVLHGQNGPFICSTINEGFATEVQEKVGTLLGYPCWESLAYAEDSPNDGLDLTIFTTKPNAGFQAEFDGHQEYPYGNRLFSFLFDTYGPEIMQKIIKESMKYERKSIDTEAAIKLLNSAVEDGVFNRFSNWYADGKWIEHINAVVNPLMEGIED